MKIKVRDLPDDLFEYTADVVPREDEFICYNERRYRVTKVCHYVEEAQNTDELGEVYAIVEVSTKPTYFIGM